MRRAAGRLKRSLVYPLIMQTCNQDPRHSPRDSYLQGSRN